MERRYSGSLRTLQILRDNGLDIGFLTTLLVYRTGSCCTVAVEGCVCAAPLDWPVRIGL
jgi:hypothetical protein